jgi:2',3'-cyclic-nucleotide 2'-phosphodiesterase/3'-nucleotidase
MSGRGGILGFLPPNTVRDLRDRHLSIETGGVVETARIMAPHLRAMGADIVIALAHSGIGADNEDPALENAVVPLARIGEIDAIVSGHDHQVFPGPLRRHCPAADTVKGTIHGTPVVSPGFWGSHLGLIDLRLGRSNEGKWSVISSRSEARPVSRMDHSVGRVRALVPPDPAVTKMMSVMHDATLTRVRRTVGETKNHLHSYFAMIAPSSALQIVHQAKLWFTQREIAGTAFEGMPIVTSTHPFKARGLPGPGFFTNIKPGPVNLRAIADLYLHRNDICALRITAAGLTEWLERAASVYCQITPGERHQSLILPNTPAYLFETLAGVDYEIDLSVPPRYTLEGTLLNPEAHRIGPLTREGRTLAPDEEMLLVTNSHRATGGGGFNAPNTNKIVLDVPVSIREVLGSYFTHNSPVTLDTRPNWGFKSLPGTALQFRSAPQAAAHVGELDYLALEIGQTDDEGFLEFTLSL